MGTPTTTWPVSDEDLSWWHGGRRHAYVWAFLLPADADAIVAEGRRRLGAALVPRNERVPHVTVAFAGLSDEPGLPGYGEAELSRDLDALSGLVPGAPLELRVGAWGSFPAAPHRAVEHPWLHTARAALETDPEGRSMAYQPHVTVGHYAVKMPLDEAIHQLSDGPAVATSPLRVDAISLLRYDADDQFGPLTSLGSVSLLDGNWTPKRPLN